MRPGNHFVLWFSSLRALVCVVVPRTDTPGSDLLIGGYNTETGRVKGGQKSCLSVCPYSSSMMA